HVDEEDKLTSRIVTSGQNRNVTIINESGLYSLIFSSKLENAKRFKRWVTSEVLPSLRRTGTYQTKPLTTSEQIQLIAQGN
ncbi:Bro-N domain-containing protein, partial [Staphylococcus aureus]|nr:Bro-N domain-containing protein [Staphylococcus aureus]